MLQRKCSKCHEVGHNARNRKCPANRLLAQQIAQDTARIFAEAEERFARIRADQTRQLNQTRQKQLDQTLLDQTLQKQIWKRDYVKTYDKIIEIKKEKILYIDSDDLPGISPELLNWLHQLTNSVPERTQTCSVCLENKAISEMVGISCEHPLCLSCLFEWESKLNEEEGKKFSCPCCRQITTFMLFDEMTPIKYVYYHMHSCPNMFKQNCGKLTDLIICIPANLDPVYLKKIYGKSILTLLTCT